MDKIASSIFISHLLLSCTLMASSSTSNSHGIDEESRHYPYPSHVNAAAFLSIKLSNDISYRPWKEQMMCLVESHDMLGFIDGTLNSPKQNDDEKKMANMNLKSRMEAKYREWKRSDTLVKGWIFGSLSPPMMDKVAGLHTSSQVWEKLETICTTSSNPTSNTFNDPISSSTRSKDMINYIPLYKAILRDKWEKVEDIFSLDNEALTAKIDVTGDSALHIAVRRRTNNDFVEKLLEKIMPEDLPTLVNNWKWTSLHSAAFVGNTEAAKMLVEKNERMLFSVDKDKVLPIHLAIWNYHKETFLYLLEECKKDENIELCGDNYPFKGMLGVRLLTIAIFAGYLDIAYKLIKDYPDMARTKHEDYIPLGCIANKADAYFSSTQYNFYQRFVYSHMPIEDNILNDAHTNADIENQETYNAMCRRSCFYPVIQRIYVKFWKVAVLHVPHIKHLHEDKVKHNVALMLLKCMCEEVSKLNSYNEAFGHYGMAFKLAVENDTHEAVEAIIECIPQATLTKFDDYYLSQHAIKSRCEKVYNFLVQHVEENHFLRLYIDRNSNNLLHLAGELAPKHKLDLVSGAALQMQRELQWFQEVEKIVLPSDKQQKNNQEETPMMVFIRAHKELRRAGEEWIKKTADSCTITTALIITIAFAAAITVPGGNNGDTGKAIYATKVSFIIFAVSDAISLFTSTTSLLLFQSILTARYIDEDFLYRLPKRLILGLATLFLSMTSMMVAFSVTLYLLFGQENSWILIPIATLTCLPIASFVMFQFPLLFELINSTYFPRIFSKRSRRMIK